MSLEPLISPDVSVAVSDLLVATADGRDPALGEELLQTLRMLRAGLKVDAVFVAEIVEMQRVTRAAVSSVTLPVQAGEMVPLERTYCQLMLEGRLPEVVPDVAALAERLVEPVPPHLRAHLSTPVTLSSGRTYGTLCCLSASPLQVDADRTLQHLRRAAQVVARSLDAAGVR